MVRPRNKPNKNLPAHLYFDATRGYRFTLVNGVRKDLGFDKVNAVQVAVEYNRVMRPEVGITVDKLIGLSGNYTNNSEPFGNHIDGLLKLIMTEEKPSKQLAATILNDAARVKEFFMEIPCCDIDLEHVNGYLSKYHQDASANVFNRKLGFLEKLFKYAIDQSLMRDNPAARKMKKRKTKSKERQRLSLNAFMKIYNAASLWLQTAMDLALQTSQARLEVSRIKYSIKEAKDGECGCMWFDVPNDTQRGKVYGTLFIHRQKVEEKEASHVAIPIGDELKAIIDRSRDGVLCPYVVHRRPTRMNKQSQETDHRYQLDPNYLSRAFSALRDELHLFDDLELAQRPTFHEIRALSARMISDMGIDPQGRMAHTDAKSTKIYVRDHLEWTEVPHVEIRLQR